MNKSHIRLLFVSSSLFYTVCYCIAAAASTITQCTQPDGSIEFTNKGCSKSNHFNSRRTYNRYSTQSLVTQSRKNNKKRAAPFRQKAFIQLQNKLVQAETGKEITQHAQNITDKVLYQAQKGKLKSAYDMIAATYVKLSKDLKKKKWEGQSVNKQTLQIRILFEEILMTQSTTSSASELKQAIESAWKKHLITY